ncbi:ATP-binding protein [Baaleninema simplex]|uniref:ATP-binding protein n=1 Tax=Baaleninema simplex TaxID=2862350 RepID=UPI00034673EE|nr:AAA family ATPase [Baaleninema simplex]
MKSEAARKRDRDTLIEAARSVRQTILKRLEGETVHLPKVSAPPVSEETESLPALERICRTFGLGRFDRDVLALCAADALWPDFGNHCARLQHNTKLTYPTFSLALALQPLGNWSNLLPESPLRYWQLIELDARSHDPVSLRRLMMPECILNYLMGENYHDVRLDRQAERLTAFPETLLPPSHDVVVTQLTRFLDSSTGFVRLYGSDRLTQREIAAAACRRLERPGKLISIAALPKDPVALSKWYRRWQREERLNGSLLLLDTHDVVSRELPNVPDLVFFLSQRDTPAVLLSDRDFNLASPETRTLEIPEPTLQERQQLWQIHLGDRLLDRIDTLATQFHPSPSTIQHLCRDSLGFTQDDAELEHYLRGEIQKKSRPPLDALAERAETSLTWEDLVLPEIQLKTLRNIVDYVRQRWKVYHQWQFEKRSNRGQGITALFSGQSGTGKTTAAEIIAKELHLDCYRIDLSRTISKYIGETEKNLAEVFDIAQRAGAVLLFDEADALFGKRSEVKEAKDRYANQEISYLLQRMETYPGLAILTTNLYSSIDSAFERRLKFIVRFPFPALSERKRIWQRAFPSEAPTQGLNYQTLAELSATGGVIANLALDAAFRAAVEGIPIQMQHIREAAIEEHRKSKIDLPDRFFYD